MKRNFLTAIAVMVTAFFVGTTIAQAADISFSGQIRPRFEANQQGDFTDTTDTNYSFSTRVRLNAKVNVNSDTSVFIQLQSVGVWGSTPANTSGTRQSTGGGGNEANDQLSDVGLHQAYFTLKNFAGMPADLKVGRQEVVLDGHRLLGNTGWTQGAETKDAIRLTHSEGNHTLAYVFIKGLENGVATGPFADGGTSTEDDNDVNIHVFWGNLKGGPLGGELSGYFVIIDDNATGSGGAVGAGAENTFYTVGARQKGKFMGLDYRAEYYYQFGEAGGDASGAGYTSAYSQGSAFSAPIDRSAYMIGVRVGKTFSNVMWKPTLTLWYDHLSGTDDDDIRSGDYGQFDTLADTGHKFYGFMDLYLSRVGGGTGRTGLQDVAVKLKLQPRDKWTFKADFHHFMTSTNIGGNVALANAAGYNTVGGNRRLDNDLGSELDLTLVHKYNANTKIVFGYSNYWATQTFAAVNGAAAASGFDDASWGYMMMDVKF